MEQKTTDSEEVVL